MKAKSHENRLVSFWFHVSLRRVFTLVIFCFGVCIIITVVGRLFNLCQVMLEVKDLRLSKSEYVLIYL